MNKSFKIAQIITSLMLVLSVYQYANGFAEHGSWLRIVLGLLSALALLGLWRRVVWGRFLTSWVVVLQTFGLTALLIPDDQYVPPFLLPIWLQALLIIAVSIIWLLPLVVLGWRKKNFRAELW